MPMAVLDAAFLVAESREHPTHVALLQLFSPPPDAGPEFVSDFHRELLTSTDIAPLMRRRPVRTMTGLGQWSWVEDDDLDMEYHVRLSALPRPGRVRELLALVSRLHGTLLDRHRPLWELHVVEGLADGRFAVYTKVHHALMDGVTAVNRLVEGLSRTPDGPSQPPWEPQESDRRRRSRQPKADGDGLLGELFGRVRGTAKLAGELAGTPVALSRAVLASMRDEAATLPFEAPRTMLNVPIGGARRFAAQSWPLERVRAVGKALGSSLPGGGATINDVAVAMCSGALRRYLGDAGELPDRSLVAFLPVSLRSSGDSGDAGNSVGGILCELATDERDPAVRLSRVRASTRQSKEILSGLSPTQVLAMTALVAAPALAAPVPGLRDVVSPPFNLIISNVPGSREALYWSGAQLLESYPVSVPAEGQALNITLTSYHGNLSFGITGCRRSVPHLQRLLEHLDTELTLLERAVGVA
jgi:diacylglycerol O-acyltransferase / wax synthase